MRDAMQGEKAILWVCDRCFKYMREGSSYELHSVRLLHESPFCEDSHRCFYQRNCHATHPPGRKVYQRGAHIIWEVDGAKEKVRCPWHFSSYRSEGARDSSFVKIFLCSASYLLILKRCSLTAKTVSALLRYRIHGSELSSCQVLFYLLTDGDSQRDHVLGFFSKARLILIIQDS